MNVKKYLIIAFAILLLLPANKVINANERSLTIEEKETEELMEIKLELTEIEKQWLLDNNTLTFSAIDYKPFDIIDSNGEHGGINKEYLDKVEVLLGVNIEYTKQGNIQSIKDVLEQLIKGEVHFATSVTYTDNRAKEFNFIKLFETNKITVIGNSNSKFVNRAFDLRNKTVALQRGTWIAQYLQEMDMNISIIETNSIEDAIMLVTKKKADYTVEKLTVLNELLFDISSSKYRFAGELNVSDIHCIAISKKYPELATILEKTNQLINYKKLMSQKHVIPSSYKANGIITLVVILFLILIMISLVLIFIAKSITLSVKRQKEQLLAKKKEYEKMLFSIVDTLEEASMWNDSETGTHNKRVCYYCGFLARKYGLPDAMVLDIKKYASLHDIGKIGIRTQILKKPGKLTVEEFDAIKKHVDIGYSFIGRLSIPDVAKNIVYYHHENFDGTGYSNGLVGEDIPIEARIMSIADVYDALRTRRVYKKGFTHEEAVEIIIQEKGKKFDPALVEIFEGNHEIFKVIFDLNALEEERMI